MAKKKRKPGRPPGSKNKNTKGKKTQSMDNGRRDEICAVILFAVGIFLIVAFQTSAAGSVGEALASFFKGCFGIVAFALPYYLIIFAILLFAKQTIRIGKKAAVLAFVIFFTAALINSGRFIGADSFEYSFGFDAMSGYFTDGRELLGGGFFGMYFGSVIVKLIGIPGLYILSALIIAICLMLLINTPVSQFFEKRAEKRKAKKEEKRQLEEERAEAEAEAKLSAAVDESNAATAIDEKAEEPLNEQIEVNLDDYAHFDDYETNGYVPGEISKGQKNILNYVKDNNLFEDYDPYDNGSSPEEDKNDREDRENKEYQADDAANAGSGTGNTEAVGLAAATVKDAADKNAAKEKLDERDMNRTKTKSSYKLPPVSLLNKGPAKSNTLGAQTDLKAKAMKLEETLQNFHVDAKVVDVTRGPAVTRYEIQPNVGVKVNSIVRLADDIALNMEAKSIRIEAPIPGKKAVGIEIENEKVNMVTLRDIIGSAEFKNAESKITFAVGRDISGRSIVANLKEMPHLLIAGSTGSGKSVCVNSIIASVLYKARPDEVKLILIDPKVVELANYNGIPHLLIPVVTEPSKAAAALNWACAEMDDRYKKFAAEGVKDLKTFNEAMNHKKHDDSDENPEEETLPQIVIIIDELADLMMEAPSQVEDSICRLAQKARAAGMHLIVATQRPSVDVITGVIKANIPSRIAFTVSSQFDSRTILDMSGAEKLVGKGDMLFNPIGGNKPLRVQGTFISDEEVHKLIGFVKEQTEETEYSDDVIHSIENVGKPKNKQDQEDELLADAIETVVTSGQASVSMLQRRFRIGYNRAARIVDMMEERKIVGPADGSRPRQVLMTEEELMKLTQEAEGTEDIE